MLSDDTRNTPIMNNNAFLHLANKLKGALESCEPDIVKLLSAIHECLAYLDVLLSKNNSIFQTPDCDTLIHELNSFIKCVGSPRTPDNARHSIKLRGMTMTCSLKDAVTQTNDAHFRDINIVYGMVKQQREEILVMMQDMSLMVQKYIPAKKSLKELRHELDNIGQCQSKLNYYLEYLKYEIIKHRVRPGKERISILMQEQESLNSRLAQLKQDIVNDTYAYQKDDQFKEFQTIAQEQDLQDDRMKSLLDILNQVVQLQENHDSIETWINRTKDSTHYMKELEIRMKCYTSQERLDSLHEIQSIRQFEKVMFSQNIFQRELKVAIQRKQNLMISIKKLELSLQEKYQNYIFILGNQDNKNTNL